MTANRKPQQRRSRPAPATPVPTPERPGNGSTGADPDPFAGLPVWKPCGRCAGRGDLVVRELTEQLRRQGQPFTVIGPCPSCGGSGGMLEGVDR